MSPNDLAEYLRVLRDANVMQANLELDDAKVQVVFAPEIPDGPLPGAAPTPGGWKTLSGVDEPDPDFAGLRSRGEP